MPTVLLDNEAHSLITSKQKEYKEKYNIDMQISTLVSLAVKAGINKIDVRIGIKDEDVKE